MMGANKHLFENPDKWSSPWYGVDPWENPLPKTVELVDDGLAIINQVMLPWEVAVVTLVNIKDVYDAIKNLQVRGAPAIGITAALGLYMHMRQKAQADSNFADLRRVMDEAIDYLNSSRPTAVNLSWALARMKEAFLASEGCPVPLIIKNLLDTALKIQSEDEDVCRKIGEAGLGLITENMGILTHCNAGALAASKYGTALAPIYLAHEAGLKPRVFADETRPILQGLRLTGYELAHAGVDVTVICDNMAATVMSQGKVELVLVGCDRVAKNGDTANKIGTLGVAILAKHYNIPFYVCAPFSTIDTKTETGADIVIEERPGEEITDGYFRDGMNYCGLKTYNPAFDVTPAGLITGFITERGILGPPFV